LVGVTTQFETAVMQSGWCLLNRIVWIKDNGIPETHRRLAQRHELILHIAPTKNTYLDLFAFSNKYGGGFNPGNVWHVNVPKTKSKHLAPFPIEIAERAITLACPEIVCGSCGKPLNRRVVKTTQLNMARPQARRAIAIYEKSGLTPEHIAAIQSTGISDAGKALKFQTGSGKNSKRTQVLAAEAKAVLGGYFREFTFPLWEHKGWEKCQCGCTSTTPGVVLDPFMGSGTCLEAASSLGRIGVGVDLNLPKFIGPSQLSICRTSPKKPFPFTCETVANGN
jgi:hypothetical protein